jgi:hypothetical protein
MTEAPQIPDAEATLARLAERMRGAILSTLRSSASIPAAHGGTVARARSGNHPAVTVCSTATIIRARA